jgi:hypothetical protein
MARTANPGPMIRLERIEGQLKDHELASLEEWCRLRCVRRDRWPLHRGAYGWLDLAVGRAALAAQRTGRARSRSAALKFVGADFGLNGDSIRKRWERRAA